ncbi:MAG: pilus assembly PilX N-terminal domain-containing protein [Nitrospinota bacterium]|nr:pilus assembly PilX N-terminal domain-containing protein [Nitrospinota bacterium]
MWREKTERYDYAESMTMKEEVSAMKNNYITLGRRPAVGRSGAVLVLALLTLAMITVMGVYSATRTTLEQQIASNMENQVMAFFAAEAGISHGRTMLQKEFVKANEANMVKGVRPNWNWILNGTYNGIAAQTYWCGDVPITAMNGCEYGASPFDGLWTTNGVEIIKRPWVVGTKTIEYTVTVWDNIDHMFDASLFANSDYTGGDTSVAVGDFSCDEDASAIDLKGKKGTNACSNDYNPIVDKDGMIFVRSRGLVYSNGVVIAEAIHELTFEGHISGRGQVIPGLAQEFANEGHSSSGMDLNEIDPADLTNPVDLSS